MNCETFQTILQDLGRDVSLNLRTRQDGLAHAEVCPNCATLLKDECRLIAGLGALAASVADAEASPRVEAALLNAFRDCTIRQEAEELRDRSQVMQVLPNRSSANNSPLTPFPSPPLGARGESFLFDTSLLPGGEGARRAGEGIGSLEHDLDRMPSRGLQSGRLAQIAAAALLAVGLVAWLAWQSSNRKPREAVDSEVRASLPKVSHVASPKISLPQTTSASPANTARSLPSKPRSRSGARKVAVQAPRVHRPASQPKESEIETLATLSETEVATEFLPLSYGEPISSSIPGGQLVRVQLPRTTLLSFGFPMSEERAPEPIKADVLLGEDGIARAIRFVHSAE